jgi:hypothetical protein
MMRDSGEDKTQQGSMMRENREIVAERYGS